MKDVHDDLHVIEHDPLACGKSVNGNRADAVISFQAAFDFARDCLEVRFRRPGTDHEKIGEGRDALEIEDDDIFRLFVRGKVGASFC
jgi:hypothetical protein